MWPSKDGGPGQEVTTVAVYWVTDRVDHCHVGFLPHHVAKYAGKYNDMLTQVTETFSPEGGGNKAAVREKYYCNKEFFLLFLIWH